MIECKRGNLGWTLYQKEKCGGKGKNGGGASCIIYLDLVGEKELPYSFKRLKINQQTENLSRHQAPTDQLHVFPSIYYKENFHGKSMYFFVYSAEFILVCIYLLKNKKIVLVIKL